MQLSRDDIVNGKLIPLDQARALLPPAFYDQHFVRENRYNDLSALVPRVHEDERFKQALLRVVTSSSDDATLAIAAANAITLLNGAQVSFAAVSLERYGIQHWRGIRIAGADLRYAVMSGLDLRGADLRGVNFTESCLDNAIVTSALMTEIKLGAVTCVPFAEKISGAAYSLDGAYCAVLSRGKLTLFSVHDHMSAKKIQSAVDDFSCVAFSADNHHFLTGHYDGRLRIWTISSSSCVMTLDGHKELVGTVAFAWQVDRFASLSVDSLRIWNSKTGQCLRIITREGNFSNEIFAFSPRGDRVVSIKGKAMLHWDVNTGKCLHTLDGHNLDLIAVAYSPRGDHIISGDTVWGGPGPSSIRIWDAVSGKCLRVIDGAVHCLAYSPLGDQYALGSMDSVITLWNVQTESCSQSITELKNGSTIVLGLAFSAKGDSLFSWGNSPEGYSGEEFDDEKPLSSHLQIWQTHAENSLHRLDGHKAKIKSAIVAKNGDRVVSLDEDNVMIIWDRWTGKKLTALNFKKLKIKSFIASPKLNQIALVCDDKRVRIVDASNGRILRELEGDVEETYHMAYSYDETFLAIREANSQVQIWELRSGKCVTNVIDPKIPQPIYLFFGSEDNVLGAVNTGKMSMGVYDRNPRTDKSLISGDLQPNYLSIGVYDTASGESLILGDLQPDSFSRDLVTEHARVICVSRGKLLISLRDDGAIIDLEKMSYRRVAEDLKYTVSGSTPIAYSSKYDIVVSVSEIDDYDDEADTLEIWDLQSEDPLLEHKLPNTRIINLEFMPDRKHLMVTDYNGCIAILLIKKSGLDCSCTMVQWLNKPISLSVNQLKIDRSYGLAKNTLLMLRKLGATGEVGPLEIPPELLARPKPELTTWSSSLFGRIKKVFGMQSDVLLEPRSMITTGNDGLPQGNLIDSADIKLGEHLGRGAFGEVKKAQWQKSEVAVKILRLIDDNPVIMNEVRQGIRKEIAVMTLLRNPRITRMLGYCDKKNEIWLIIEYVHRGNLCKLLQDHQIALEWSLRVRFAADIIHGLRYLHEQGVLHLDLKSANVLVTDDWRCKLSDFGLSKVLGDKSYLPSSTKMGTPVYSAPEIFKEKGKVKYSKKMDIYSLGVLLWETAARTTPYVDYTIEQLLMQVIALNVRAQIPEDAPIKYSRLLSRCWDANPQDRPDADEAVTIIDELCREQGQAKLI